MSIVAAANKLTLISFSIALFGIALVGCDAGGSGGDTRTTVVNTSELDTGNAALIVAQPELQWEVCTVSASLECATLVVPMDYSNPEGQTINVAMARVRLRQATPGRSLLINPGGPGGSGIGYLAAVRVSAEVSAAMQRAYNFVSFDPRGIGQSTPIDCDPTELLAQDFYMVNREEVEFNFQKATNFAQSCSASAGEYPLHLGSYNVVRDMNEMRKALGLTQIDFLGYSYGSRLAALYMQTYPQSTGRFVLDGSMTPDPSLIPLARGSLLPGQVNLDGLAQACIGITIVCSPLEFAADLQVRVDVLGAQPHSQESDLLLSILQIASTRPGFEQLFIGRLAAYLETEDVAELEFLDNIFGISESAESGDGINRTAFIAVMCADDAARPTVDSIESLRPLFNADSDLLGEGYLSIAMLCAGWPASVDPIPQIATNQAPASLVIGGPSDAQTPLIFSQQMAAAVGGQFLRSEHDGHTTVFTNKNSCTNTVVEEFLLNGNLPSVSVCAAGGSANSADWHEEIPRLQLN